VLANYVCVCYCTFNSKPKNVLIHLPAFDLEVIVFPHLTIVIQTSHVMVVIPYSFRAGDSGVTDVSSLLSQALLDRRNTLLSCQADTVTPPDCRVTCSPLSPILAFFFAYFFIATGNPFLLLRRVPHI